MDMVKEEPIFEDGMHEITTVNEFSIDMKYEECKVPVTRNEDRVSSVPRNLKIGNSLWVNN
jgi:hypothetical protein